MKLDQLKSIVSSSESNPYISWNDPSLLEKVKNNSVFNSIINNNENISGYFKLLHSLTKEIDGIIVECGNREGLGIISVYDALKENSKFYTLDIVDDVRFVTDKIKNDNRVYIMNNFDSLDAEKVKDNFDKKSISMIFFDTIHTYEQLSKEYEVWHPYMKDDCIMLVDDIRDYAPGRSKWKFHQELDWSYKKDVGDWAHKDTGFGVYFK